MKISRLQLALLSISARDVPTQDNSDSEKLRRMIDERRYLQSITGQDHQYDLLAWHKCLITCSREMGAGMVNGYTVCDAYTLSGKKTVYELEEAIQNAINSDDYIRLSAMAKNHS